MDKWQDPEADVAEQAAAVSEDAEPAADPPAPPSEANEADVYEQQQSVPEPDEDHRQD